MYCIGKNLLAAMRPNLNNKKMYITLFTHNTTIIFLLWTPNEGELNQQKIDNFAKSTASQIELVQIKLT